VTRRPPPTSTPVPYTTLFRSPDPVHRAASWTVGDVIGAQARRVPDRIAVDDGRRSLSYRELDERACRLANCLRGLGVGHGSRIRSEEHTSELQSRENLVCRLL